MKQLMQKKLMWGVIVITVTQVLGMLPALDFLPPLYLKIVSFALGVALTVAKGVEMFFEQSAQLEKTESTYIVKNTDGSVRESGASVTTKSTPTPAEEPKA